MVALFGMLKQPSVNGLNPSNTTLVISIMPGSDSFSARNSAGSLAILDFTLSLSFGFFDGET